MEWKTAVGRFYIPVDNACDAASLPLSFNRKLPEERLEAASAIADRLESLSS